MALQVVKQDGALLVQTPHVNKNFNKRIKDMGGVWHNARWRVDARNEALVRAALKRSYGGDGQGEPDVVTVRCTIHKESWQGPVDVAGRVIARAFGRDSGATLGDGVVLVEGRITSGGSRINWTSVVDATVVLHDCPRKVAEKMIDGGYVGVSGAAIENATDADAAALADGVD
ncbi:hypothetical protein [Methylobacterium sp. WL6]|uniref:hypothetical protein n=1 Tax=Methylobacterium sp. WL6 TaxID=2603901 RepID=UPI0011C95E23|nr:hypothetical protein [Methylobacterium sp. WL6]TXN73264.1 hypothetical protein FV230_01980 [Methylobacterium sp. WL6]